MADIKHPKFIYECVKCGKPLGSMVGNVVQGLGNIITKNGMIVFQCPVDGEEIEVCANNWDVRVIAGRNPFSN